MDCLCIKCTSALTACLETGCSPPFACALNAGCTDVANCAACPGAPPSAAAVDDLLACTAQNACSCP